MKISREDTPDRQVALHIEVDEDRLDDYMRRASQRVSQRVSIPGFRKGKAPRAIVERFAGRDYLLDQALEALIPTLVGEAIEEQGLEPVVLPQVTVREREPVVKVDAVIALSPEVKLGDYTSIRFDDEPEAVTDSDVRESLEQLRNSQATWEPVERALESGDLATITLQGHVAGKPLLDLNDVEFLTGEENAIPAPGFSEALVGMQIGETREFTLALAEDYPARDMAGKDAKFSVTVNGLKQKNLPPVDDDLAKSLDGDSDTLEELEAHIRRMLESRSEEALNQSLQQRILDVMVDDADIRMAPVLVKQETQRTLRERREALEKDNLNLERYIHATGMTVDQYVSQLETEVSRRLRQTLVMDELAEAENVEVTDGEVSAEIEKLSLPGQEETDFSSDAARDAVRRALMRRGALDRALELARQEKSPIWTPADAGRQTGRQTESKQVITMET